MFQSIAEPSTSKQADRVIRRTVINVLKSPSPVCFENSVEGMGWHPVRCNPDKHSGCNMLRYKELIGALPFKPFQQKLPYLIGLAEVHHAPAARRASELNRAPRQ